MKTTRRSTKTAAAVPAWKNINAPTPAAMVRWTVKIFRDGEYVDTQTVDAPDEWKARTAAMAYCRIPMRGALVEYEVTRGE